MFPKDGTVATLIREIIAGARAFFLEPLKRLYYIGHILLIDLPRFLRRLRGGKKNTTMTFRLLATRAVTFREACRLIDELNIREGFRVAKPPILCEEFCRLLHQDLSHEWRLPLFEEVIALRDELCADALATGLPVHPARFVPWTIDSIFPAWIPREAYAAKRYAYAVRTLAPKE